MLRGYRPGWNSSEWARPPFLTNVRFHPFRNISLAMGFELLRRRRLERAAPIDPSLIAPKASNASPRHVRVPPQTSSKQPFFQAFSALGTHYLPAEEEQVRDFAGLHFLHPTYGGL